MPTATGATGFRPYVSVYRRYTQRPFPESGAIPCQAPPARKYWAINGLESWRGAHPGAPRSPHAVWRNPRSDNPPKGFVVSPPPAKPRQIQPIADPPATCESTNLRISLRLPKFLSEGASGRQAGFGIQAMTQRKRSPFVFLANPQLAPSLTLHENAQAKRRCLISRSFQMRFPLLIFLRAPTSKLNSAVQPIALGLSANFPETD